jgi:hypothetical protein
MFVLLPSAARISLPGLMAAASGEFHLMKRFQFSFHHLP